MVWFRVDDNFADHEKVRAIPRAQRCAAIGLWTLAGTWSARHLKDGLIPRHMLDELAAKPAQAAALVAVDLWHVTGHGCDQCPPVPDGFYLFHDYTQAQFSRERVESKREADRERLRKWREQHATNDASNAVTPRRDTLPPSRTRPEPSLTTQGGERPVTLAAADATEHPPIPSLARCAGHIGVADPGPCNGCRRAREKAERDLDRYNERAARDLEAAIRDCPDCEGTHIVLDADKQPTGRRCSHRNARKTA